MTTKLVEVPLHRSTDTGWIWAGFFHSTSVYIHSGIDFVQEASICTQLQSNSNPKFKQAGSSVPARRPPLRLIAPFWILTSTSNVRTFDLRLTTSLSTLNQSLRALRAETGLYTPQDGPPKSFCRGLGGMCSKTRGYEIHQNTSASLFCIYFWLHDISAFLCALVSIVPV